MQTTVVQRVGFADVVKQMRVTIRTGIPKLTRIVVQYVDVCTRTRNTTRIDTRSILPPLNSCRTVGVVIPAVLNRILFAFTVK